MLIIALFALTACASSPPQPPGGTATPLAASAPSLATTAATATVPSVTTPLPSAASSVPPTPTSSNPAGVAATGTALSATSQAFTASNAPALASPTAPPADPQAQAIIDRARTRFAQLTSLHFLLTVTGDVYLDQLHTEKLTAAEGDLVRPDQVSLTARIATGPLTGQLKLIQIGDTAYLTDILTGKWQQAPAGFGYDPRVLFDPNRGVAALLGQPGGWTLGGTEQVNGTAAQHVHGSVPVAAVDGLIGASLPGDTADVDLYVTGTQGEIVRVVLGEQASAVPAGTVAARWTFDLSKQNAPVTITAPTIGGT